MGAAQSQFKKLNQIEAADIQRMEESEKDMQAQHIKKK